MVKRKECNDSKKHYVDKKELREEIVASTVAGRPSDKLADMFIKITDGVGLRFKNLDWYGVLEDVKQDCLLLLCQKFDNYDPERRSKTTGQKTSPFAFLTTIVYNHMRYKVTREKSRKEKVDDMTQKARRFIEKHERGN